MTRHDPFPWLEKVDDDLAVSRIVAESADGPPGGIAFHAQQAVEKVLKALWARDGVDPVKTHDLRLLLQRCLAMHPELSDLRGDVDVLNPLYTGIRYPPDVDVPIDRPIALDALDRARRVVARVRPLVERNG